MTDKRKRKTGKGIGSPLPGFPLFYFVSGVEFVIYRDGKYVDFFGESLSLTSARSAEGRPVSGSKLKVYCFELKATP